MHQYAVDVSSLQLVEYATQLLLLLFHAGRILGCHVFGAHSADLAQEASVLMCLGSTVEQLRDMVHIHPTLSEILFTAAEA